MKEDDLKALFDKQHIPDSSEKAKQQAVQAALIAFRESHSESSENNLQKKSTDHQGNENSPRPTLVTDNKRNRKMVFFQQRIWMGGIAAGFIIAFGVLTFHRVNQQYTMETNWGIPTPDNVFQPSPPPQEDDEFSDALAGKKDVTEGRQIQAVNEQAAAQNKQPIPTPRNEALGSEGLTKEVSPTAPAIANTTPSSQPMAKKKAAPAKHEESKMVALKEEESSMAMDTAASVSGMVADAEKLSIASSPARAKPQMAAQLKRNVVMPEPNIAPPTDSMLDRDRFSHEDESPVKKTSEHPVSTFSIDVDTASYSYVRRQLNSGVLPQKDAVRVEEMINYFDYDYPLPDSKKQPFLPTVMVHDSPWKAGNKLIQIGIKGFDIPEASKPDSNIVFLLDVSGSMNSPDKLPLVKQSMSLLLDTLKPTDTVAIVVYAGAAGAVLEPTPVKEKATILAALNKLQAGGSTAGAAGIQLAYQLAELNFKKQAVNRVILATDGDFNVGITQDERLEDFVSRKRDKGIYLSVLGFGQGNYQDALMQTLAQNGNGIAAYIDTLSEAQKVLVHEATSTLFPIANDVKIQVEFNPATISEYRLIGYETRALKREDFNNDKVDAGDIGAGHSVTAIYEITPTDSASKLIPDLRYTKENASNQAESNEYGFLKLRYKRPGESTSQLLTTPITKDLAPTTKSLNREAQFATAVTGFAQLLKGSKYIGNYSYDDIIDLAQKNKGDDPYGYRTEFVQLVRKAKLAKDM